MVDNSTFLGVFCLLASNLAPGRTHKMEKSKLLKKDPDFLYKLDLDAFEIFKCRHAIVR